MSVVTYLDFYIEVTELNAPEYQIRVRSQAGEARADTSFPYTQAQLDAELLRLEHAILYIHTQTRRRLPRHEEAVRNLGIRFFEFLLPNDNEVRSLYYECQKLAEFEGKGVRINLLIRSPYLSTLPWEFLHDPRSADYIALDPFTPLVRYPEIAKSTAPLLITPPLRILGLVANPKDLDWIDVDAEKRQIKDALQPLLERRLIELTWLPDQTWRKLQQWMRPNYGPWHIFHFIGHGEFDLQRDEGRIFLTDEDGRAKGISATELGRLLRFQRSTLRLAILNACEGARGGKFDVLSSTAATLVMGGLPAVLAMQYAITDTAAIEFARTFYESLADGLPVDAAMSEARKAISFTVANTLEWGTPVLYSRATDGRLFDMEGYQESTQEGGLAGHLSKSSHQNFSKVDIVTERVESSSKIDTRGIEEIPVPSKSEIESVVAIEKQSKNEIFLETADKNTEDILNHNADKVVTIEQSLDIASVQRLNDNWRGIFLPTVRKECGLRVEAALRGVRDIAISQDSIAMAFGSNNFTRELIAESKINVKVAAILSQILGRSVKLECQAGERAQLLEPLVYYAISTLGAKLIRHTTI